MKKAKEAEVHQPNILYKTMNDVLHDSMIPYTEHVVMDRALPRVEDGLKPVQRRILYSMMELGVTPDKPYRKSARIVGDCMGKYHPHGDSSVYDAMVRMAQNYSLRAPLVDGHGNFGSIDGDSAAAMRYTEARLAPLALEILRDLDKNTVDWSLNFDDTLKEPNMLPGRFPNLLVNGATGIAVGVATNIPPHNLGEVIDGTIAYIKNPKITLTQMMKYIKAPDFPTGGEILAGEGLKDAYLTGKGKIALKSKISIEKDGDKSAIVITEIPYQVNKATLLQKIAELKEKEKGILSYIGEITDESDRNGMRAVIRIKKDGNAKAILNTLLKSTNLQISYAINMVAIAGGKPKQLGLLEIISYYVDYQVQIIIRRTKFELDTALAREHIVKGLLIAIKNIDEIIKIIKKSAITSEAKEKMMARFILTDIQAQAILDMRISRLVNLEVKKLEDEFKDLQTKIKNYKAILASKSMQEEIIVTELKDIKKRYDTKRKSGLSLEKNIEQEEIFDLIDSEYSEPNYILLSADHRLKRMIAKNGVGTKSLTTPSNLYDVNTNFIKINDNQTFFVLTNKGNLVKLRVKDIPLLAFKGKGDNLCDINKTFKFDEFAVQIFNIIDDEQKAIAIFTKLGTAKRMLVSEMKTSRNVVNIMPVREGDEIINAEIENEQTTIIAVTKLAYSLRFNKSELPIQKRGASGVKMFKLQENDSVVLSALAEKIGSLTVITKSGLAKKVPIGDYEIMSKYRRGLRTINLKNEKDEVVFANFSLENFDFVLENKSKLDLFSTEKLHYDTRTSKGKQIQKINIENAYVCLDKIKLN